MSNISLSDLKAQRDALDRQIAETTQQQRGAAIADIRAKMAEFDLTLADLGSPRAPKVAKTSKVAAKYRNNATGETWSGRGLKPKWLSAAINAGGKLEDFHV